MNKVSLIFPSYLIRNKFGWQSDPPIGLTLIVSVLEAEGCEATIIDADAENLAFDSIILKFWER